MKKTGADGVTFTTWLQELPEQVAGADRQDQEASLKLFPKVIRFLQDSSESLPQKLATVTDGKLANAFASLLKVRDDSLGAMWDVVACKFTEGLLVAQPFFKEVCGEGAGFLPPPSSMSDPNAFLRRCFEHPSPASHLDALQSMAALSGKGDQLPKMKRDLSFDVLLQAVAKSLREAREGFVQCFWAFLKMLCNECNVNCV